jgi:pimeloyl-ACP methyl ester carboxylesterase
MTTSSSVDGPGQPTADVRARLLATTPIPERRLDLAGVSTAVLDGGDGPPIVLLHGPGAYGAAWLPVIPALLGSHRVIAPDLPGHGASVVTTGRFDADRVLTWLGELVAQTCRQSAVLVGHLTGGAIAARFAAEHGHLVSRLVLVTPTGFEPFEPAPAFGAVLASYLADPTGETHDDLWRACVRDLDDLRRRMGTDWDILRGYNLDRVRTPQVAAAMRILIDQFAMNVIPPQDLVRIDMPASLIWGSHDAIVRLSAGEAASSRYGWPLHVIDAGNEPALEEPAAFLQALRTSLSS